MKKQGNRLSQCPVPCWKKSLHFPMRATSPGCWILTVMLLMVSLKLGNHEHANSCGAYSEPWEHLSLLGRLPPHLSINENMGESLHSAVV